jgi:hypothetical protein
VVKLGYVFAAFAWFNLLVTLFVGGGVGFWLWMRRRLTTKTHELTEQEARVQVQLDALASASRINEEFWRARVALRDEATRQGQHPVVEGEWI